MRAPSTVSTSRPRHLPWSHPWSNFGRPPASTRATWPFPEINGSDAGYLFVAEQTPIWAGAGTAIQKVGTAGWLGVYRWAAGEAMEPWGTFGQDQLSGPPNFVFLDRFADTFVLGVVPMYDGIVGRVDVFTADASELFPEPVPGYMDLGAFRPASGGQPADFPVDSRASQVHTVTDVTGQHYLLAFRGEPPDTEDADDFVDLHTVTFPPSWSHAGSSSPSTSPSPPATATTSAASTNARHCQSV